MLRFETPNESAVDVDVCSVKLWRGVQQNCGITAACRGDRKNEDEDPTVHLSAANGLQFTGANRDAMKQGSRSTVNQRFASGATVS